MILSVCPNPSIDTFAWIDDITPGGTNRFKKERRFPGGKGVHVALAVAELGEEVRLLGIWGGTTGQWVREACEAHGVLCHGPETADWSRTCVTFKSQTAFNETELLGAGPTIIKEDMERLLEDYARLIPHADFVTMSGSWPKGAPADAYARLIHIAHAAGKETFLDTTGEQLAPALEQHPHVVHMNRTEVQDHFKETDLEKGLLRLAQQCGCAVVTSGAEGVYVAVGNEIHHAVCQVSNVYSAVGSGDCLLGGLVVGFQRGLSIKEIVGLGAACGAANCIREDLGMFYRKDVEMFLAQLATSEGKTFRHH